MSASTWVTTSHDQADHACTPDVVVHSSGRAEDAIGRVLTDSSYRESALDVSRTIAAR